MDWLTKSRFVKRSGFFCALDVPSLALICSLLLAGCSGGQSGGSEPPPVPSVQVTMTSPSLNGDLAVGDEMPLTVNGSWSGTNVQPSAVYLHVRETSGQFMAPESKSGSLGAAFTFS